MPGAGQSAGVARGFRHLHATREQIDAAIRARAGWDAWSERAGEPLLGEEGALRLGGDVEADAARLRAAGIEAAVLEHAGERHPALAPDAGPLLWDPRGGAIRAAADDRLALPRARRRHRPNGGARRRAGSGRDRGRPARVRPRRALRGRGDRAPVAAR